ncbi:Decaprenyl diphosphate synthase-like protein [Rubripirellula amarantea]|uniref:Isoprenyl transferase n=1 Tax=Rubripirellula amarantea TaxID=2527999 RepID=A0A5C5WX31_9BACT|nr:polyprenyl diphosphate synthase [Rubripirellula amarantea]TWT55120.1 Decaprenyl diphosphate synthase-like protein [Rubripirellula amarantea]
MSDADVTLAGDPPAHVAIIMDGNGRWAQARGLPRIEGHRRGVGTVRMISETATELGIDAVTLYCLSSENWKRPQAELDFLMHLLEQYLIEERRTIMDQGLRLRVIGRRDRLPQAVIEQMNRTLEMSADNPGTQLVLAIDYGGRDEITRAARSLATAVAAGKLNVDDIDEARFGQHLYTEGLPEIDLMIRTGGDMRVSNFLLWQISYAELWVTETCWPEFDRNLFITALNEFATRQRRFGGLNVNE